MQKKAIALAIAGLVSGGAFAQTVPADYIVNDNDVSILVDNDAAGYGNFIVVDQNGGGSPVSTIYSNAQSTTINTEGAGNLTVATGGVTTNGTLQNNGNAVVTGTLAAGNTTVNGTLSTTGNATVGGTLGVTGLTTTAGITNNGALQNNGNAVVTGTLAAGNTTVNGTLTTTGNATVNGNFTATTNAYLGGATPTLTVTSSAVTVENGANVNMGDNQVHGVANGTARSDVANWGQVQDVRQEARRGIAAASAVAGIPALESGKQYNFGVGLGHYKGESALALGGNARFDANTVGRLAVGFSGSDATVSAGVGWSF